jgi:TonB family protein
MLHFELLLTCMLCMPSDTPPARVAPPAITELKASQDVIAAARLANGEPPPPTISLPVLQNREELNRFAARHFPESASSKLAEYIFWMHVDESGKAQLFDFVRSSGDAGLDSLAARAATLARFTPASISRIPVALWIPLKLDFQPGDKPSPTPHTKKPKLLNGETVAQAMSQYFPREFYNRGFTGEVVLWIKIDEAGNVIRSQVKRTSGYIQFDNASHDIAKVMRFSPAENKGTPIPVWFEVPIRFRILLQGRTR